MKIGFSFNMKKDAEPGEPKDKYAEFDDPGTIDAIKRALEKASCTVTMLEADEKFEERARNAKKAGIGFVFNIAEGLNGPARESYVPIILDNLGIPYSGSGAFTLALTLDKSRTNETLRYYDVPVPDWWLCSSVSDVSKITKKIKFPVIIKPNCEGSSKGILNSSVVSDQKKLEDAVRFVTETYKQPAIVQKCILGREFTVSVIGNDPPRVLPIVEVTFDYLPKGMHPIDSYEVKWIWDNPDNPVDPIVCPAKIDKKLEKKISDVAIAAYNALGCVDFCRMDMRLDEKGVPCVLDVNALPGMIPDPKENSRFPKAAYAAGFTYDSLINEVLTCGLKRAGKI